jgi:signal transduction histidine kinase
MIQTSDLAWWRDGVRVESEDAAAAMSAVSPGDADERTPSRAAMQQLNARLEQCTRQLTALHRIGRTLAATLDLREIYWVMYRQIAQGLLGTPHFTVALFDQRTETIYCGFAIVDGDEIDPTQLPPIPLGDGPVSDTIRTREPRIVDLQVLGQQLQACGRAVQVGDERQPQSALYVPMISGDRVVGVMHVQHYAAYAFRDTDLPLLSILASQAAIALENAQLFAEAQRHTSELEQRVAERTRDLAEANERLQELDQLKDQFISNVSHELRTPLANIKLYVGLLEHGRADRQAHYIKTLHRESGRLGNLIEDLLELSRLDLGAARIHLEPTYVNHLAAELIGDRSEMATDRGLALDCQLDPDLPLALGDPKRIVQVMSNLMSNAINYTPRGGIVTLLTASRRWDGSDWVTLTVQDTGPGISAEELPKLFKRFFRGEASRASGASGTGLGLAICKEIVEAMAGHISVESRPGQGTAFTVWLQPAGPSSNA